MEFLALTWIPVGLLIGVLTWIGTPDRSFKYFWVTLSLGLFGGFLGGILSWIVYGEPDAPFRLTSILFEATGALVITLSGVTVLHFRRGR